MSTPLAVSSHKPIWLQIASFVVKQPLASADDIVVVRQADVGNIHIWPLENDGCLVIFEQGRRFIAWRNVEGSLARVAARYSRWLRQMSSQLEMPV